MKKISFMIILMLILAIVTVASATGFRDFTDWIRNGYGIHFSLQTEMIKLPQFSDARTDQLNRLLKHISFEGSVANDFSLISVFLDDEPLFRGITSPRTPNVLSILSADNMHVYSPAAKEESFSGEDFALSAETDSLFLNLECFFFLDSFSSFAVNLPSFFPNETKNSKIDAQRYRDYGIAVKKTTISLDGELLNSFVHEHPDIFNRTVFLLDPENCSFTGRQTISLYYTEEDHMIRFVYNGKAEINGDDLRAVAIDWKTVRKDAFEKDEFKLETPNSKKTKRDNLQLVYTWQQSDDGTETIHWKRETDQLDQGKRTKKNSEASFLITAGKISGTISKKTTEGKKNTSFQGDLNVSLSAQEHYSGTLEINHKNDKIEKDRMIFHFDLNTNPSFVSAILPEEILLSPEEYNAILDGLYSRILKELLKLPEEDITFLKDSIPEDLWSNIL